MVSIVCVLVDVSPVGVVACIGLCSRSCKVIFSSVRSCVLGGVCVSDVGVFNLVYQMIPHSRRSCLGTMIRYWDGLCYGSMLAL